MLMRTDGTSERLYLIWRDPESRAQHKVGELSFDGFQYCFQYDSSGVASARSRGFVLLPAFPDENKRYESVELFPTLVHRLPDAKRPDYGAVSNRFGLKPGMHPFQVLRRTGGRLATDQLSFEEAPQQTSGGQTFQCYVAGWRFYDGESTLPELGPGTRVVLERDTTNRHDANAVAVFSTNGRKLGYIPAYHSELTASALAAGRQVRASIVQINPPPASTNERARIRVEVSIL
jgi:hypothetical protein